MATIIEILERLTTWSSDWKHPAWKQYVLTGDQKLLKQLPDMSRWYGVDSDFLAALHLSKALDEPSRRALEAFYAAKLENALGQWLGKTLTVNDESLLTNEIFLEDPEFDAPSQRTANAVNSGSADLGEILATANQPERGCSEIFCKCLSLKVGRHFLWPGGRISAS